ncbi:MAG: DUF1559 domain-containing protein [Planctomycetota bacterium]|nr:DUF1559 domain-containing protein [Planctomycetota bacterium]
MQKFNVCLPLENTPRFSGFSLVETIVCLTIVALVFAIAVPVVVACRDAALRISCRNRFRQVGLAAHIYYDSFSEFPGNKPTPWPIGLGPYLDDSVLRSASTSQNGSLETIALRCPLDVFVRYQGDAVSNHSFNPMLIGVSVSRLHKGWSNTIMATEMESSFGATWVSGPLSFPAAVSSVHKNAHIVFADGSVRSVADGAPEELFDSLLGETQ